MRPLDTPRRGVRWLRWPSAGGLCCNLSLLLCVSLRAEISLEGSECVVKVAFVTVAEISTHTVSLTSCPRPPVYLVIGDFVHTRGPNVVRQELSF